MERTSFIEGDTPVLLVAPHGPDDFNTDYMAETIAREFGAYAVINRGWKKSPSVDFWKDLANCNDVRHLHSEVVKEEFLNPILRSVARIKRRYEERAFVLILHGCSDKVRDVVNDDNLDLIVGAGDGRPPSSSCRTRLKNAFMHHLQAEGFGVYEGGPGGLYAGKSKNNLNQLFVKWYPDKSVDSVQLEITHELRSDEGLVQVAIEGLISAIDSLMLFDDTTDLKPMEIKRI